MDAENLKTASLYINNQLLSRGLLRNGQSIDFAHPDGANTTGRIMSVINDLILRRDRDAAQRETLTNTIRKLRADALRQSTEVERLFAEKSEGERKLNVAEAEKRTTENRVRSGAAREKGLREEVAKLKVVVQQVRKECAIEVRKREKVAEALKRAFGEGVRIRGGGKAVGVREITVVGGIGEQMETPNSSSVAVGEDGYDLRSETNEFLTELARGLSEENETITSLVRGTLETLRALSGWETTMPENTMVAVEMGVENLASELEAVIEHIRTLLTNPSFVPLEEVEIREEEIFRLRQGWEHMENRWREAVGMMDGWRKRMMRGGSNVNLDELKMGLLLSPLKLKKEEAQAFQLSMVQEEGEGDAQADIDAMDASDVLEAVLDHDFDEDEMDSDSSLFEREPLDAAKDEEVEQINEEDEDEDEEEKNEESEATFNSVSSASLGPVSQLSPLRETSGNRTPAAAKQQVGFSPIMEENTLDLLQLASSPAKSFPGKRPPAISHMHDHHNLTPPDDSHNTLDENDIIKNSLQVPPHTFETKIQASQSRPKSTIANARSSSPPKPSLTPSSRPQSVRKLATPKLKLGPDSRLPRPRDVQPIQSPLTMAGIAAKLAASEREADAARVRAKLKAAKLGSSISIGRISNNDNNDGRSSSSSGRSSSSSRIVSAESQRGRQKDEERALLPPLPTIRKVKSEDEDLAAGLGRDINVDVGRNRKRKATGRAGRTARRRSTLSPWELESLMLGSVVNPGKGKD